MHIFSIRQIGQIVGPSLDPHPRCARGPGESGATFEGDISTEFAGFIKRIIKLQSVRMVAVVLPISKTFLDPCEVQVSVALLDDSVEYFSN